MVTDTDARKAIDDLTETLATITKALDLLVTRVESLEERLSKHLKKRSCHDVMHMRLR